MRRALSRLWTAWIRCCPFLPAAPNGTVLNIIGTGRFRSLQRSTPKVVKSSAEPLPAIPAQSSWLFSNRSLPAKLRLGTFISSPIISGAHRTSKVWEFLERNRNVRIHYTPTYSSWLNQVEIWFSKIQRDVIARGIFCSVKDLARKLIRYIRSYNKKAKPF